MEKLKIEPMLNPGDGDYLPCEECDATHWAVIVNPITRHICETRADAEEYAEQVVRLARADRFIWGPDDVEHHND
jgi:hypothetical protein